MTTDLFRQNLQLFEKYGCSDIAAELLRLPEPSISVVGSLAHNNLNIDIGRGHFYQDGAIAFSQEQVNGYLKKPNRFCVTPPMMNSVFVNREANIYKVLIEEFGSIDEETANKPRANDAGFLISFGLGLGLHLPELIRALDIRDLVIAEQYIEMLQLSLRVLDWQPIFETLDKRNGKIHITVDTDPATLANKIFIALRGKNFGLIDGSYGIQHYASSFMDQVHGLFREMLPSLGMSDGFFDDECLMFKNTLENLSKHKHPIYSESPKTLKGTRVFIVGSGPSLDQTIEEIRKHTEKALIISAGTGLGVLLSAGIKPHIHCETENQPIVYEAIKNHRKILDFSGITLIASPTVDPRIPDEFDKVVFAHRDTLTSSILFGTPDQVLTASGPTVANFASRIALGLGASEIYFFGIDLGAITPSKHHSAHSTYNNLDDPFWNSGLGMLDLNIEVEGNFRQSVFSNALFVYIRSYFHSMITNNPQCRFFNCSDGSKILGAAPLVADKILPIASELKISNKIEAYLVEREGKAPPLKEIESICTSYLEDQERWYQAVLRILHQNNETSDYKILYDQLTPWLETSEKNILPPTDLATRQCNKGTLLLILQFGYFYLRRISPEKTNFFFTAFRQALLIELEKMQSEIKALIKNQLQKQP